MKARLHQFLSRTGIFKSKSDIIKAIYAGEVSVDGKPVRQTEFQFNPNSRKVEWNGRTLSVTADKRYFFMNKPKGYLSSKLTENDRDAGKKSLFDLIDVEDSLKNTLFTVGRLDEDSEGLIILTNDGDLSDRIAKPEHEILKRYHVGLAEDISQEKADEIEKGLEISTETGSYRTKPCKVEIVGPREVYISLSEGKKREVKLIFQKVGNRVIRLTREAIGDITLESLEIPTGKYVEKDRSYILEKIKKI
jgi:pseudouridine synthase